jgi:hypothetical protein
LAPQSPQHSGLIPRAAACAQAGTYVPMHYLSAWAVREKAQLSLQRSSFKAVRCMQGRFMWMPCHVESYDAETELFLIRWPANGHTKHVRRLNLVFDKESHSFFRQRLCQARKRRSEVCSITQPACCVVFVCAHSYCGGCAYYRFRRRFVRMLYTSPTISEIELTNIVGWCPDDQNILIAVV